MEELLPHTRTIYCCLFQKEGKQNKVDKGTRRGLPWSKGDGSDWNPSNLSWLDDSFTIHMDATDYQLGAVISQNNNLITFFSRKPAKAQWNYTTTEKELLAIIKCLKQFRGILFSYPIDVWSDHKNLVYAATLNESQQVIQWCLILKAFGPNIQHIAGIDNIVADTLSHLPSANTDQEDDSTESLRGMNKLFMTNGEATNNSFPLKLSTILREQNIELNKRNSKLSKNLLEDKDFDYNKQVIDDVELIFYKNKIYVPQCLRMLDWYHLYLNHPGGDWLAKTLTEVCYWEGLANQARQPHMYHRGRLLLSVLYIMYKIIESSGIDSILFPFPSLFWFSWLKYIPSSKRTVLHRYFWLLMLVELCWLLAM